MLPSDYDTTADGANRRGDANGRSDIDASDALVARDAGCRSGGGDALVGAGPYGGRLHFELRLRDQRCDLTTVPDWLWLGLECSPTGW